jgi:carbonic anhydrase
VEHLQTPVLLILGHTGCGAVKAALGDISSQSEPIKKELETLHVSKPKPGTPAERAWADAVVENVRSQVDHALTRFGARVQEGKLTIVGAIYDFRNDLGNGAGKITIVDVNGNTDAERMQSFVDAVEGDAGASKRREPSRGELRKPRLDAESPEAASALKAALSGQSGPLSEHVLVRAPTRPDTGERPSEGRASSARD